MTNEQNVNITLTQEEANFLALGLLDLNTYHAQQPNAGELGSVIEENKGLSDLFYLAVHKRVVCSASAYELINE